MRGARVGEGSTFGRAKGLCIGLMLGMKLSLPSSVAAVKIRRRNLSALGTRRAFLVIAASVTLTKHLPVPVVPVGRNRISHSASLEHGAQRHGIKYSLCFNNHSFTVNSSVFATS